MRMRTKAANDMREINDFVNENGITKEQIVDIFTSREGMFYVTYFAED